MFLSMAVSGICSGFNYKILGILREKGIMSDRFIYKDFSCEVDIFKNGKDVILRFYEVSNEQKGEEIVNFVAVDPGYNDRCTYRIFRKYFA